MNNEMKTVPIMIAQLRAADYSKFDLGKVYMFILLSLLPAQGVKGRCHLRPGHCRVRMEFPRRLKDPVIGQIACRTF